MLHFYGNSFRSPTVFWQKKDWFSLGRHKNNVRSRNITFNYWRNGHWERGSFILKNKFCETFPTFYIWILQIKLFWKRRRRGRLWLIFHPLKHNICTKCASTQCNMYRGMDGTGQRVRDLIQLKSVDQTSRLHFSVSNEISTVSRMHEIFRFWLVGMNKIIPWTMIIMWEFLHCSLNHLQAE